MQNNHTHLYGTIGKALCGCGGAIVGFATLGPIAAILGIIPGLTAGHLLEKAFTKPIF